MVIFYVFSKQLKFYKAVRTSDTSTLAKRYKTSSKKGQYWKAFRRLIIIKYKQTLSHKLIELSWDKKSKITRCNFT